MKNSKIAMPTVYVPTWKDVGLQHSLGVAGVLDWSLIDRKNYTKPVVVKRGRQRNKIMLQGFNKTHGLPRIYAVGYWMSLSPLEVCMAIGTGTAEPNITDTNLTIPLSTSSYHDGSQVQYSNRVRPSYLHSAPVTFDESVGNGDLTEWGVFFGIYISSTLYDEYFWCKELFRDEQGVPVVITKTSDHLLRLQYQLYWDAPPQQQSIINIDGANYTVTTTIADRHVLGFACHSGNFGNPPELTATLGTDNTPTLNTDYDIKGSAILSDSELANLNYNAESHTLSYELELVGSQANSSIGEIALYNITPDSWSRNYNVPASQPICRTTIDPPFTKTSTQKLKLYYEITSMPDAYDLIKIPTLYDEPGAQASIHSLAMYD